MATLFRLTLQTFPAVLRKRPSATKTLRNDSLFFCCLLLSGPFDAGLGPAGFVPLTLPLHVGLQRLLVLRVLLLPQPPIVILRILGFRD